MNTNEETPIPRKRFLAVVLVPVVVFVLANALFLPVVISLTDSEGGLLNNWLIAHPTNNPYIINLIYIVWGGFCLPVSALAVLVGPLLTSFLVNRKYPVFTNRSRAILGGGIFLAFHTIFLIILLVFRLSDNGLFSSIQSFLVTLQSTAPMEIRVITLGEILSRFLDPLLCLLTLGGIALSCGVAATGRFGARRASMKNKLS
jgi:hypothetical protein